MVRTLPILVILMVLLPGVLVADDFIQTDWSGGDGLAGPVSAWQDSFSTATGVSWLAVPGQIALAGTPLASPV